MIDEETRQEMLTKLQKVLADWKNRPKIAEPRKRWFEIQKGEVNGTHGLLCVIVGKDEIETMQIVNDLVELSKKYRADQRDIIHEEDFTERRY